MRISNLSGQTIGQYELRELYATGGMGAIYRAYQLNLDREVAFKVITLETGQSEENIKRFYREARLAASLEHPHIVPIYDYGQIESITYITMRLLTGGSLAQRIEQRSKAQPSLKEVSILLQQVSGALDYAHSLGVVHRDIKANNVMFDNHGTAYLVDFGIARAIEETGTVITASGMLMGTPTHMAPEQWKGEEATARTDEYALGVMVYHMITGKVPFEATTPYALMTKHVSEPPPPLQNFRNDVPEAITPVLERALAKEPADRYATISDFYEAFAAAAEGAESAASDLFTFKIKRPQPKLSTTDAPTVTPVDMKQEPKTTIGPTDAPKGGERTETLPGMKETVEHEAGAKRTADTRRLSPGLLGVIALVLAAVAVGGFLLLSSGEKEPPAPTNPVIEAKADVMARSGPDADYAELIQVKNGEQYDIIGISEDGRWYQILLRDGSKGWVPVSESMFAASGNLESVEVAQVATITPTPSSTPTDTPTTTPTPTDTTVPTDTPTPTFTPSDIPTDTPTITSTPTDTPTLTFTPSDTPTDTPTITSTPTDTPTLTFTPSDTPTDTPTPTFTPSSTPTDTPTLTPTLTDTPTETPVDTDTPEPSDTPAPTEVAGLLTTGGSVTLRGSTVFRNGPGNNFDPIVTLGEGTFPITGRLEEPELWYQVNVNGQLLWVSDAALYAIIKPEAEDVISVSGTASLTNVPIAYGETVDGRLSPNQDATFIFEGKAGDVVSIAITTSDFDSRLELYGENSPLPLSQDDDSGGNLNPLINGFELQNDGTYQITLRGYSPTAAGAFRMTLQEGEFATPAVGNTIAFGQTIVEPMTSNQEAVYTFKATEGDVISVSVQAGFDTFLQILGSDDRLLISDDDSGGDLNPLIEFFEIPNTGEYKIVLRGYSASSVGTFQLTLSKSFSANTSPIAYGETLTGLIQNGRTVQFVFSGEVNDRITIFVESDFDTALELRDTAGNSLIRDDDSGGNLQPLIENFVLPDTSDYVILVTGFAPQDEGNFTIVLQKN